MCLFISVLGFCGLYHSVVNAEESESFDEFTVYYSNYTTWVFKSQYSEAAVHVNLILT